jgi:hypothetical protein
VEELGGSLTAKLGSSADGEGAQGQPRDRAREQRRRGGSSGAMTFVEVQLL